MRDFTARNGLSYVVGYQTQTAVGNNGITWALSTFKQIGKELSAQTLASFALPTDQGFTSGDSIILEIYDETGSLEGTYSFVDDDNVATYGFTTPGWYPLEKMQNWEATDEDLSNDVVVPFGKGVIITSGETDTTLTLPNPMGNLHRVWHGAVRNVTKDNENEETSCCNYDSRCCGLDPRSYLFMGFWCA